MSFKFSARAILELGKELISTDEVALFELIKNSVDAASPRVEIIVSIQMLFSDYTEAISKVTDRESIREILHFLKSRLIDPDNKKSVALIHELDNSTNRKQFLTHLKNYYDELNYIEIRDTGHGMSITDLSEIFLRIGTDSRRKENLVGAKNLGDKGIGRLSAMRLGYRMQVKTTRIDDQHWNLLDIDWSLFSSDEDIDAESIIINPEVGDKKVEKSDQGTSIRISALQANWDKVRFIEILQGRIARMVDPFVPGLANKLIIARHNGTRVLIPCIPRELLKAAHAVCHVEFKMEGEVPTLKGYVDYKLRHKRYEIDLQGTDINSISQNTVKRRAKRGHAAFKLAPLKPSAYKELGNFKCDMYWYNRLIVTPIEGLTTHFQETRKEISHWSGGPMLYRYGFRILPYGDPKDDWLSLDETAFSESGFKLNRQQLIGRVLLETAHRTMSEQTNREGLVASETYYALRNILAWVVHVEMRQLINEADRLEKINRREAEVETGIVEQDRKHVEATLERLRKQAGELYAKQINDISKSVKKLTVDSQRILDQIQAVKKEAHAEREKFLYLAGIGLMTEFIFHELERAVSYTISVISTGAVKQTTIKSLRDQLTTLHKRIAAFDELTGEKRQRKSKFDLVELVENILANHERQFERHGISVSFEYSSKSFVISAVRGMVIQILENLIVNAAYWLKHQKIFEKEFEPSLVVTVDPERKVLTIEDNGPGVAENRREQIFQPFISNKPAGQGRGLGLYIARELAEYHGWKLHMDELISRIREGRTNMFVLSME